MAGHSLAPLSVGSADVQRNFRALAPQHPLPWQTDPAAPWVILDGSGKLVVACGGTTLAAACALASAIAIAFNTCGGYRAEPTP